MTKPERVEAANEPTLRRSQLMARIALKTAIVLIIDFVLVRIWGPNAIDRHDDGYLAIGIACFAAALAITIWLVFQLAPDVRRLAAIRRADDQRRHLR